MKQSSKTAGLLLEIILSIVFLACICVVTLQLFLNAQQTAQYSKDKSGAIHLAQSIGDMFQSRGDFEVLLKDRYTGALLTEEKGKYKICLDEDMNPSEDGKSDCFLRVEITNAEATKVGYMNNLFIQVQKQDEVLFDFKLNMYKPGVAP